jgi:ADP-L-glycero-D-manno-heptose 6-epimerase
MYIVTGGAGFIGSNIIQHLNNKGITDILVVDNLEQSEKFTNINHCQIADYLDKREFRAKLEKGKFGHGTKITAVLHQGACSNTMEYNGLYMMDNNYTYSKELLHFAIDHHIPFIYASSAAVYGASTTFVETPEHERPLNIYGYSKLMFDNYVRQIKNEITSPVVGLRYFNVYGPNEHHKGRMASTPHQFIKQLRHSGEIKVFGASHGYADGEHRRDFVCVDDLVAINLHFAHGSQCIGVFNVGTGESSSFNEIAQTLIHFHGRGNITYLPFPDTLIDKYQAFTQANISALRKVGYRAPFIGLAEGLKRLYAAN